jgi:IS605 OrfB family transposase
VYIKEIIDLKEINNLKQDGYKKNKRDYETSMINAHIIELAKSYKAELVAFELLNIESKDHGKGKNLNRLLNNNWNKRKVINNLRKRCVITGIRFVEVPAAYSSFIGQLTNENEYDSVAASIELSRRAFLMSLKKKVSFRSIIYPRFTKKNLPTRWKKMVEEKLIKSWKKLYNEIKKSKARYRFLFSLDNFKGDSFSLKSPKSLVWVRQVC